MNIRTLIFCCLLSASMSSSAIPAVRDSVTLPFDFSRSSIGLNVTIKGKPVYMILDTGVDPSVIDLPFADSAGLPVDRQNGGEASGFGDGKGAAVFPSRIEKLQIAGTSFAPFDALASDLSALSAHYGRKLDGVLGYSFLVDKSVLIDYPGQTLSILNAAANEKSLVQSCRQHWTVPLRTSDSFPVITRFRLGSATGPITLDTGSNGGIALYQSALTMRGVRTALTEKSSVVLGGARGESKAATYTLNTPVGFGPFTLPAGQIVTVRKEQGSKNTRVGNGGNALFAALKLKMLLDYRHRSMSFYGSCD